MVCFPEEYSRPRLKTSIFVFDFKLFELARQRRVALALVVLGIANWLGALFMRSAQ